MNGKEYALKLLLLRRYTGYEIKQKLIQKGFEDAEKIVDYLTELGYINDEEYVRKYVSDAVRLKKFGRQRIGYELLNKGVDPELISRFTVGLNDYENLLPLVKKKFSSCPDRDKIRRYFINKGYDLEDIDCCLSELESENGFED